MTYRIIKVQKCGDIHYELQVKKFLFWSTETGYHFDQLGGNEYTLTFESPDLAKKYFCKHYSAPLRTIVSVHKI